ncbi:MAG: T9SS type A sorting domain-containing protein [Flavobacteriia bacterium]|nr:T9SS type A sorting domain-containing protein [Flavobacteriia bacterium]
MKKTYLLSLVAWMFVVVAHGQTQRVLFIGNSYTNANNLPQLVADVASSLGDTLIHDKNTPGGYTLQSHSTDQTTLNKIALGTWDYVVFQEQSQRPSFPPSQVATEVLPYASALSNAVRGANACTEVMFYMTWGRENGDQSNCASYPPICTYTGMQNRLRSSYLLMGQQNSAEVSPVGAVWRDVRTNYPSINLYTADESHPNLTGSYLAALTFYASIFHKPVTGAWLPSGVSPAEASSIQMQVNSTVFDSLGVWMIDTTSLQVRRFFYQNGCTVTADYSDSQNADSIYVDFGNGDFGSTFIDSTTYSTNGVYVIQSTLYRECDSLVTSDTIVVNCSIGLFEFDDDLKLYPNPTSDFVTIPEEFVGMEFSLVDLSGRTVKSGNLKSMMDVRPLQVGRYILRITSEDRSVKCATILVTR